jgi:hypothetical protein
LTLLVKALLVDIDPRAGWADALLRSLPKQLDAAELMALAGRRKVRRRWRLRQQKPVKPRSVLTCWGLLMVYRHGAPPGVLLALPGRWCG